MHVLLGVVFHFIGGFRSGSFYPPFQKGKNWSWEAFWIVVGFFSWLFVPPIAAALTLPSFASFISAAPFNVLALTYLMGVLWGIGGLTYGLGIRFLGMSLGSSVTRGYCGAFRALIPPLYYSVCETAGKVPFHSLRGSSGGQWVLLGVAVCLIGIAICGYAGMLKEKSPNSDEQNKTIAEFSLFK